MILTISDIQYLEAMVGYDQIEASGKEKDYIDGLLLRLKKLREIKETHGKDI